MNEHDTISQLEYIKSEIEDQLDSLKDNLNCLLEHGVKEPGTVDDLVANRCSYFTSLLDGMVSLYRLPVKSTTTYQYLFVTISDNDFFHTLNLLGKFIVHSMDHFSMDKLVEQIPALFSNFTALVQYSKLDLPYVQKHIKILNTEEAIIDRLKNYGLVCEGCTYTNPLLSDNPKFAEVVHTDYDSEALLVKLAYTKDGTYCEDYSDYLVF